LGHSCCLLLATLGKVDIDLLGRLLAAQVGVGALLDHLLPLAAGLAVVDAVELDLLLDLGVGLAPLVADGQGAHGEADLAIILHNLSLVVGADAGLAGLVLIALVALVGTAVGGGAGRRAGGRAGGRAAGVAAGGAGAAGRAGRVSILGLAVVALVIVGLAVVGRRGGGRGGARAGGAGAGAVGSGGGAGAAGGRRRGGRGAHGLAVGSLDPVHAVGDDLHIDDVSVVAGLALGAVLQVLGMALAGVVSDGPHGDEVPGLLEDAVLGGGEVSGLLAIEGAAKTTNVIAVVVVGEEQSALAVVEHVNAVLGSRHHHGAAGVAEDLEKGLAVLVGDLGDVALGDAQLAAVHQNLGVKAGAGLVGNEVDDVILAEQDLEFLVLQVDFPDQDGDILVVVVVRAGAAGVIIIVGSGLHNHVPALAQVDGVGLVIEGVDGLLVNAASGCSRAIMRFTHRSYFKGWLKTYGCTACGGARFRGTRQG